MANEETERRLQEIAALLAEDEEYPLDGTLLYAEVDDNYVAPSIFKDRGDDIVYREPDLDRLGDALLDLWYAQDSNDPWEIIDYVIRNGRFDIRYTYPDEIDREEEMLDRRTRIVEEHFGKKPVVYPPWRDEKSAPTYDL